MAIRLPVYRNYYYELMIKWCCVVAPKHRPDKTMSSIKGLACQTSTTVHCHLVYQASVGVDNMLLVASYRVATYILGI